MPSIIASYIKELKNEVKQILSIDINDLDEEAKDKLRKAIKYFSLYKKNIDVQVEINGEIKPCGRIYFDEKVFEVFKNIVGNRVKLIDVK